MGSTTIYFLFAGGIGAWVGYRVYKHKGRNPWPGAIWCAVISLILTPLALLIVYPYLKFRVASWEDGISPQKKLVLEKDTVYELTEEPVFPDGVDSRGIQMLDETIAIIPLGPRYLVPKQTSTTKGVYVARMRMPDRCAWSLKKGPTEMRRYKIAEEYTKKKSAGRQLGELATVGLFGALGYGLFFGAQNEKYRPYKLEIHLELPATTGLSRSQKQPVIRLHDFYQDRQVVLLDFQDRKYASEFFSLNCEA
ncbi:MAG: hypothetical protein H6672_06985 [Anaerolineaceae bacterium]|nr:hypothetical protein [Anaerolineaceae bacterium]